jgi:CubicO group peptidase (beta-lactamase class C family)
MEIGGSVGRGFESVRDAFAKAQADDPGGAQLCIYRHGEIVVDLWAGRDIVNDRPYDADMLTVLMSCTKGATAICALMLAQQGLLDVDAPVARYWPEFAANGKDSVTVAHCLSHTAGLPTFPMAEHISDHDLPDWEKCVRVLANAKPLWTPGAYGSYHAVTYGFLVGEIVRRISGLSLGAFFAKNIAQPLGMDFWIGLPASQQARVAPHIPRQGADFRKLMAGAGVDVNDPIMVEILAGFDAITDTVAFMNTPAGRAAELPAANGIANARALARMYAACIGEVDGVRLLDTTTLDRARTTRTRDLPPLPPLAHFPRPPGEGFGLGFALGSPVTQMLGPGSFGHDGAGGRLGFAHPEFGIAAGFACNSMLWDNFTPDPRWAWVTPLAEIAGKF